MISDDNGSNGTLSGDQFSRRDDSNGKSRAMAFRTVAQKRISGEYYRGDSDTMDSANLINGNKEMCRKLFGTDAPDLERKIYFFDSVIMIRVLRDPSKEIDVIQYEYPDTGRMCFLVGEQGAKEELVRKGFLFVHECMLCSPIKVFIDIDCQPPLGITPSNYNALLARVVAWITKFKRQVEVVIEGLVLSAQPKEEGKKKKKKADDLRKKFCHEWSVQCAHRGPTTPDAQTKISFHVINNSSYDKLPVMFPDLLHVNAFLKKHVLSVLSTPLEFQVDNSFTYKGKTIRCYGAAKREEPLRVFVSASNEDRPFDFHCVQPDNLRGEYYAISTVPRDMRFDDLYPETDFVLGAHTGRVGGNGGGGGGGANVVQRQSNYQCTVRVPLTPANRLVCDALISAVAEFLRTTHDYAYVAKSVGGERLPYSTENIKTDQNRERLDICIRVRPGVSCLIGSRCHHDGKGNMAMQLCIEKGAFEGVNRIAVRCKGTVDPVTHPKSYVRVSAIIDGDAKARKTMDARANTIITEVFSPEDVSSESNPQEE
jgi:hypothetical protein